MPDADTERADAPLKISVILPCFNGAGTLRLQLDALTRQSWPRDSEVLFVDNGSTDTSVEIAHSYLGKIPGLRIVRASPSGEPAGGADFSYCAGLDAAGGNAFLFCEADDEVADDWFTVMADELNRHHFITCALEYRKLNAPALIPPDGGNQSIEAGELPAMMAPAFLPFATGCCIGFTRRVVDAIGPPASDCGIAWDTDWSWRAQQAGYELTFIKNTHIHYRLRDNAKARLRQARAYGRAAILLRVKHGLPGRLRFLKYAGGQLMRSASALLLSPFSSKPYAYHIWYFGYALGEFAAFPEILKAHARKAPRPISSAAI